MAKITAPNEAKCLGALERSPSQKKVKHWCFEIRITLSLVEEAGWE